MTASRNGHTEIVKLLLNEGAKADGWVALVLASENGHIGVVELLLERGADIEAKRGDGFTTYTTRLSPGTQRLLSCF